MDHSGEFRPQQRPSGLDTSHPDHTAHWPGEPAPADVRDWPLPWLLRLGRDVNPVEDDFVDLTEAHRIVNRYKGPSPHVAGPYALSTEGVLFTRGIVRDSLVGAPQPIRKAWVRSSLGIVGSLVAAVEADDKPLTRAYVLSNRARSRFLHRQRADFSSGTRRTYRSRIEVITGALAGKPVDRHTRTPIPEKPRGAPYTRDEQAALVAWVSSLGVDTQRERGLGIVGLAGGCGARPVEILTVRGTDVTRDAHGVPVRFAGPAPRTVTCLADYEDLLWDAAQTAGENLVAGPWTVSTTGKAVSRAICKFNGSGSPVVIGMTWLRATWMVRHLAAGTPLAVLMPAAALTASASFDKLLRYVPADPDPAARLRDARP
jgi:hypothetical protein